MTIENKTYDSRDDYKNDSVIMNRNGYRSLHQNIIDGKLQVTWVSGNDDPGNETPRTISMTEREFIRDFALRQGIKINFSFKDRVRTILGL